MSDHTLGLKQFLPRVVSWTPSGGKLIDKHNLESGLSWVSYGLIKILFDFFLVKVVDSFQEATHSGIGYLSKNVWEVVESCGISGSGVVTGEGGWWASHTATPALASRLMTWETHPCSWVLCSKWGSMLERCDPIVFSFDSLSVVMQYKCLEIWKVSRCQP